MRKILAIILLTISPALWANCTYMAYAGVAADVITTTGAIESGKGEESNPIYPDGSLFYPTLLAMAAVRIWAAKWLDDAKVARPILTKDENGRITSTVYVPEDRYDGLNCLHAGISFAAAGNNAAVWADRGDDRLKYAAAGAMIPIISFTFGGK